MARRKRFEACRFCISFERCDRLRRLSIKVVPPRGNQFEKRRFWQIEASDRIEKGSGDRIGLGLARSFERVPPPLQPDFAKQGLGDDFVHPGDFETESIEGVDVPPQVARDKKAREPAVFILAAEQPLAIGVIHINWLQGHGGACPRVYPRFFAGVAAGAGPPVSSRKPR